MDDETLVPLFRPNKICSEASRALTDPLRQYIQDNDFVATLRLIFAAKLFIPIVDTYRYTRTYEQGLATAEYLMDALTDHVLQITAAEWHNWMAHFFYLQLQMLDYLNQWEHYVACYDQVKQAIRSGQIDAKYDYLFLPRRYEIIQRKLYKKQQGHKLGNLLRHQQGQLSQEEIDYRFRRVMAALDHAASSQSGSLWF